MAQDVSQETKIDQTKTDAQIITKPRTTTHERFTVDGIFRLVLLTRLTRKRLPNVEQGGWIEKSTRHYKRLAKLDTLIAGREAQVR